MGTEAPTPRGAGGFRRARGGSGGWVRQHAVHHVVDHRTGPGEQLVLVDLELAGEGGRVERHSHARHHRDEVEGLDVERFRKVARLDLALPLGPTGREERERHVVGVVVECQQRREPKRREAADLVEHADPPLSERCSGELVHRLGEQLELAVDGGAEQPLTTAEEVVDVRGCHPDGLRDLSQVQPGERTLGQELLERCVHERISGARFAVAPTSRWCHRLSVAQSTGNSCERTDLSSRSAGSRRSRGTPPLASATCSCRTR